MHLYQNISSPPLHFCLEHTFCSLGSRLENNVAQIIPSIKSKKILFIKNNSLPYAEQFFVSIWRSPSHQYLPPTRTIKTKTSKYFHHQQTRCATHPHRSSYHTLIGTQLQASHSSSTAKLRYQVWNFVSECSTVCIYVDLRLHWNTIFF